MGRQAWSDDSWFQAPQEGQCHLQSPMPYKQHTMSQGETLFVCVAGEKAPSAPHAPSVFFLESIEPDGRVWC